MKTNVQQMKDDMIRKFGKFAIGQSVWLHTRRTTDLEEMTTSEIESLYGQLFPKPVPSDPFDKLVNSLVYRDYRAIILKEAQYMGIHDPGDWKPFNNFMIKRSVLKKPLPAYKLEEFEALIKQFKSMRSKYDQASKIPGTWEWYHKNKLPFPSKN